MTLGNLNRSLKSFEWNLKYKKSYISNVKSHQRFAFFFCVFNELIERLIGVLLIQKKF
jgi:hypothetical protein